LSSSADAPGLIPSIAHGSWKDGVEDEK
jgi:hypothetical protein